MRARTIRSGSFLKLYAKGRHIMNRLMTLLALLAVALSLGGCATNVLEQSGKYTAATGQTMTDIGTKNEQNGTGLSLVNKGLKWGGGIQTTVGNWVQNLAGKKTDNTPASDGKSSGK